VLAAQGLAVYELIAKEVFVPNVQAGEDINPCPFESSSANEFATCNVLHASNQPLDVTVLELIVFSVGWRKPKSNKTGTVKVMQKMDNLQTSRISLE
jgi:hypothetical protein